MRDPARGVETVVALLTRACQLDCVYCKFERGPADMTPELLRACIDALPRGGTLQFLGGEPLLRMELVEEGLRHGRGRVGFALTTNGLLLDERKLERLEGVRLQLSHDGPAQVRQRGAAAAKAGRALELLRRSGREFSVHMVVSPDGLEEQFEAARRLGGDVHVQYRVGVYWSEEAADRYYEELRRLGEALGRRWSDMVDANEPAIVSRGCTVDTDGLCYLGCTVPAMELILPRLKECNALGRIGEAPLDELVARRPDAAARAAALYPDDPEKAAIIRSNLRMGELALA